MNNIMIENYKEKKVPGNDRMQIRKNIYDFLQWYKTNIKKCNSFKMLGNNTKGYCSVDRKAFAGYLHLIKSSGLVSSNYIAYWQKYFNDKALQIKNDKHSKDEVPEGMDFDLILITREPEIVLDNIDRLQIKVISMSKSKAVISVSLPSDERVLYDFEMQKANAGWLIDYISTANYD